MGYLNTEKQQNISKIHRNIEKVQENINWTKIANTCRKTPNLFRNQLGKVNDVLSSGVFLAPETLYLAVPSCYISPPSELI